MQRMMKTSAGAGDHGSEYTVIALMCQLVQAAPRFAQLMAAPGGALRKLVELASVAEGADDEQPLGRRSIYTTLRIMHSFVCALPDPQARDPPNIRSAQHCTGKAAIILAVCTLRAMSVLGERARQVACPGSAELACASAKQTQVGGWTRRQPLQPVNLRGVRGSRPLWRSRRN